MKFRKWLKQKLPTPEALSQTKGLTWLGKWLKHHPNLVHFNRHSVPLAVAIGLCIALLPLPLQTVFAAGLAFLFRVNVVIAIVATWVSNPLTFVPINILIYYLGNWVSGTHNSMTLPTLKWNWHHMAGSLKAMLVWLSQEGEVYLIGWFILSCGIAILGYVLSKLIWRLMVYWHLCRRRNSRRMR